MAKKKMDIDHMQQAVEISKITLKLRDTTIEMSIKDARTLHKALNELLGAPTQPCIPIVIERPAPWPPYSPWWTFTSSTPENTCGGIEATWQIT